MTQNRTRADEAISAVVHCEHEHIHATNRLVQDAARIGRHITGHIYVNIRNESVEAVASVIAVKLRIGPIDGSVIQARVPACEFIRTTTPETLGLILHQPIDKRSSSGLKH